MRGEDGDFVTAVLKADGGIDNKALGPADSQIRVEEDNVLAFRRHCLCLLAVEACTRRAKSRKTAGLALVRVRCGSYLVRDSATGDRLGNISRTDDCPY